MIIGWSCTKLVNRLPIGNSRWRPSWMEVWPSWISNRQTIHKFSTEPPNDHSCKVTIQLAWWFLTRRVLKFQPIRTRYWFWQPYWISDLHQKHKSGRGPSSEHFWQVWLKSVQWFQRRRFKCEKLTDGRRTLTHDKSSHGLWPGELKKRPIRNKNCLWQPCLLMDRDKWAIFIEDIP